MSTLLGIWAHPDDEAYLSAALMATARAHGDRVVVVTATPGERGTSDPQRWPPHRLAARRRRELSSSLALLGVREHHLLGFADGRCEEVDGTDRVVAVIEQLHPDTIVTFGPDGMTGHPDHVAVSQWVTRAWERTGRAAALWYATQTPQFHERWGSLNDEVGMWAYTGRPPCTPAEDLARRIEPDGPLLDRKVAALRAHASQTDPLVDLVGLDRFRHWFAEEAFVEASRVAAPASP